MDAVSVDVHKKTTSLIFTQKIKTLTHFSGNPIRAMHSKNWQYVIYRGLTHSWQFSSGLLFEGNLYLRGCEAVWKSASNGFLTFTIIQFSKCIYRSYPLTDRLEVVNAKGPFLPAYTRK